jgi:hypothetical protein
MEFTRPKICLNMVVKDNSESIINTLTNLLEKVNIDYWVISDLGSEDNTKELKEKTSFKYLMDNLETNQTLDDDCALEITDLDVISENSEPLELKSHESIYLEIYKKAKQKAKEIRRNAVEAFLEAKNIKLKYNLTNIVNDSSSDEDN